jgi:hypothetical protein
MGRGEEGDRRNYYTRGMVKLYFPNSLADCGHVTEFSPVEYECK